MSTITIHEATSQYIDKVFSEKSQTTARVYQRILQNYMNYLCDLGIDVITTEVSKVNEKYFIDFFTNLSGNKYTRGLSASTTNVYYWAILGWYKNLHAQNYAVLNLEKIKKLIYHQLPKPASHSGDAPSIYQIANVISHVSNLDVSKMTNERECLRLLRDRALILTLADTDMDLAMIMNLRKGDVDWKNNLFWTADMKGKKHSYSFTPRVATAIKEYLNAREKIDKATKRTNSSLPVFSGHGPNTNDKVIGLSGRGIYKIIETRAQEALGIDFSDTISPRSFRSFSIQPLIASFPMLHPKIVEKCQILFETGQYDVVIFNAMKVIEEAVRDKISADPTDLGTGLMNKMLAKPTLVTFSDIPAEQEAAVSLFRGAIGSFKNPHSHRFISVTDPIRTYECLALASMLMRMLDEAL